MKYKLLFVDDEIQILEGIQDSLRKHRKVWDMTFICGGEAAIVEIEDKHFDVIISDMRMPLVDGVDVLKYASKRRPNSIRIMLSGYSEVDKTIKVSSLAHRYLTKPCDMDQLEVAVTRSLELSKKLNHESIKEIAGSIDLLPLGNQDHQALLDLINSEDASLEDISKVIESNAALTMKVLHLVNSAFFRRQRTIVSAKEAVAYLGMDLVKSIMLAGQLFSLAEGEESIDYEWLERLQNHSLLTGSIAKYLMQDTEHADAAFTAGLLHEAGTLVLGVKRPEILQSPTVSEPVSSASETDAVDTLETPIEVQLGAYMLNIWGVPNQIVEAVGCYQNPSALGGSEFDLVGAVHVANHLANVCMQGESHVELGDNLDTDYLKSLNLESKLEEWLAVAQGFVSETDNSSNDSNRAA